MRIVALVKSRDHVCCRYRVAAFQDSFLSNGWTLQIRSWPRWYLSQRLLRNQIGSADVLILQRRMPSPWQMAFLRRVAPILIYDVDDALFVLDSYNPGGLYSARRAEKFRFTVQSVDRVITGNSFLTEQAALWTAAENICTIPTCIDLSRYSPASHDNEGPLQLAWIGSNMTLQGLEAIRPTLESMATTTSIRLKIICDKFLNFQNLRVIRCPWSETTEATDLANADIGISWLPDDLWSRGKCGLKILQYMAAGLPVVANAVGMQRELVQDGVTGFLAHSPDEFRRAVAKLGSDPALRREMGLAGRRRVERDFNVCVGAKLWREILTGVAIPQTGRMIRVGE